MLSQLLSLTLMARVLSPEDLGQLLYCFALVSIFLFLNQLGLDTLLVKKILDNRNEKHSLIWHTLVARFISALLCIMAINAIGMLFVDSSKREILFIISLYHLFLPFSTFEWYFQAEGKGELAAKGLIAGQVCSLAFRLYGIFFDPSLEVFALAYIIEVAIPATVYLYFTHNSSVSLMAPLSITKMKSLVSEAMPLLITGAVILLYMKVDQIMLGAMVGEKEVAYYVAATRLSEAWYFVGLTLIGIYFPKIIETLNNNGIDAYHKEIVAKGRLLNIFAITLAVCTTLLASPIVNILYGDSYADSANVLSFTIWAVPFVYIGSISTKMYVIAGKELHILYRGICGLLFNIFLNLILIQKLGSTGAAISTLASQFIASYLINCISNHDKVFSIQSKILLFK
ncbi:hypothetical protein C4K68_23555 [Pokkaliibacter plantistimulans]|uniref:Uncharacterized protein n=2 Tax=Pseudomonadota TaxID=1224 RepID=A0A2S5KJG2_9PROT|nr:hypothetical protein C4K68_23555 [Pokkaliibacter plantistimulans]